MNFSQYLDPIKDKLVTFAGLLKETLAPLLERLEVLPYYPYSVMGVVAAVLLLLILLLLSRKRSGAKNQKGQADPNRPRVTGVAVGMSSHEDFMSGGYSSPSGNAAPTGPAKVSGRSFEPETVLAAPTAMPPVTVAPVAAAPVMNAPVQAVPTVSDATVVRPAVARPEVTAVSAPAVPAPAAEPVIAASQDPELDAAIGACQENFRSIYMGMYIQFAFASDFETFRAEVASRLNDAKVTHRAVSELKMTPHGLVLAQMASVAGNFLQSGRHHTGKGEMDQQGQELMTIYRYALNTMRDESLASPADVQNKLDFMARKVLEIGG